MREYSTYLPSKYALGSEKEERRKKEKRPKYLWDGKRTGRKRLKPVPEGGLGIEEEGKSFWLRMDYVMVGN